MNVGKWCNYDNNFWWYDVESVSLSGWEYFDCVRGLGFKSYVCQLCVI